MVVIDAHLSVLQKEVLLHANAAIVKLVTPIADKKKFYSFLFISASTTKMSPS